MALLFCPDILRSLATGCLVRGLPSAMVVERTFVHAKRCPRLARNDEVASTAALNFYVLADAMLLIKRVGRKL